jgi:hypothetical protein
MRRALGVVFAIGAASMVWPAPGCAVLEPLEAECGNGVLDPGEDCDGNFPGQAIPCREATAEDRCRFDCSSGEACPPGFGCGADDVCRRPSGMLGDGVGPFGGRTSEIVVADIDADRFADILHTGVEGLVGLYFFDADTHVETELALPSFTAPSFADLTGDGLIDIAMPVRNGPQEGTIVVLLGVGERDFSAQSYTIFQEGLEYLNRFEILDGLAPSYRDDLLLFAGIIVRGLDPESDAPVAQLPNLPFLSGELAGLAAHDYLEGPDSPCDELAAVKSGEASVFLMTPCRGVGGAQWNEMGVGQLSLPPVSLGGATVRAGETLEYGAPVDTGVLAARLNLDDAVDLLVALDAARLGVAYGAGNGTFADDQGTPNQTVSYDESAFYKIPCQPASPPGFPLAVGALESSPLSFLVTHDGIYLGSIEQSRPVFSAGFCNIGGWAEAVVADFNGDGHEDVAAVDEGTPAIDFFAGSGDGAFTFDVVPTLGRIRRLRAADVDGDSIQDLIFTVITMGGATEELTVSYGAPFTGLSTPEAITTFDDVRQVAAGRLVGSDAAADIFVSTGTGEVLETALLFGSSDRFLQAPYRLQLQEEEPLALAASTGQLDDEEGLELAVLTRSLVEEDGAIEPYRLWLLRFDGSGQIVAIAGPPLDGGGLEDARMAPVDVEGDGRHEIAIVTREGMTLYRWQDTRFVAEPLASFGAEVGLDGPGTLHVRDIDGDLREDLFFTTPEGAVYVLWNDGGFDPAAALILRGSTGSEEPSPGLEGAGALRSVAALNLDGDALGDLVVTTDDAAFHVSLDGRLPREASTLDGILGGRVVQAGDVNGDGVADLAIGTPVGFRVYPGIPREPGQ